jgi:hypothetical protein
MAISLAVPAAHRRLPAAGWIAAALDDDRQLDGELFVARRPKGRFSARRDGLDPGEYAFAVPRREERDQEIVRHGTFWDVLEGRREPPPAAVGTARWR